MGINIFLFVWFYLFYDLGDQFFYTRHLLGVSKHRRSVKTHLSHYPNTFLVIIRYFISSSLPLPGPELQLRS